MGQLFWLLKNDDTTSKIELKDDTIVFQPAISLARFDYAVTLRLLPDGYLEYRYDLTDLWKILLFVIIFIIFLYRFMPTGFVLLTSVLIGAFYVGNVLYLNRNLQRLLLRLVLKISGQSEEAFDAMHFHRVSDPGICPACGLPVSPDYNECLSCGLNLPKVKQRKAAQTSNPQKNTPTSVSNYQSSEVVYHFKEKKKNKTE